jgi:hypothetical protein
MSSSAASLVLTELTVVTTGCMEEQVQLVCAVIVPHLPGESLEATGSGPAAAAAVGAAPGRPSLASSPERLLVAQTGIENLELPGEPEVWVNCEKVWVSDVLDDAQKHVWAWYSTDIDEKNNKPVRMHAPAGLLYQATGRGYLLVGGDDALYTVEGRSITRSETVICQYGASPSSRRLLHSRRKHQFVPVSSSAPVSHSIWEHTVEMLARPTGPMNGFVTVSRRNPATDRERSLLRWVQGPLREETLASAFYDRPACGSESFAALSDGRVLVQTGPGGGAPYSDQHLLDPTLGDRAWLRRVEVTYAEDLPSDNQRVRQLPDGTILIAEQTRLHAAKLHADVSNSRQAVLKPVGTAAPFVFDDIREVLLVERGLLLIFDGRLVRFAYDRQFAAQRPTMVARLHQLEERWKVTEAQRDADILAGRPIDIYALNRTDLQPPRHGRESVPTAPGPATLSAPSQGRVSSHVSVASPHKRARDVEAGGDSERAAAPKVPRTDAVRTTYAVAESPAVATPLRAPPELTEELASEDAHPSCAPQAALGSPTAHTAMAHHLTGVRAAGTGSLTKFTLCSTYLCVDRRGGRFNAHARLPLSPSAVALGGRAMRTCATRDSGRPRRRYW